MTTPKIDPLWGYFVTSEQPLSNLDHVTLIDLYQPRVVLRLAYISSCGNINNRCCPNDQLMPNFSIF